MKIDFGKNDEPIKLDEMIRLLKNHETVTFTINGLGETTIDTILFKDVADKLAELERLAEIGRATEKAFEKDGEFEINLGTHNTFYSVNELVEYFKED